MKFLIFFVTCCVFGTKAIKNFPFENFGYYWRNWNVNESIPFDAVDGGINKNGDKTYIAKTMHPSVHVIVPGKVVPEDHKMYFEFNDVEHVSTEDIEILCALNTKRLRWVKVTLGTYLEDVLSNGILVIGGRDRPKLVAIGRKTIGDEVHIGKVLIKDKTNRFQNLRLTQDGKGWIEHDNFEVLFYNNHDDSC